MEHSCGTFGAHGNSVLLALHKWSAFIVAPWLQLIEPQ
jgi:hypothetical protein